MKNSKRTKISREQIMTQISINKSHGKAFERNVFVKAERSSAIVAEFLDYFIHAEAKRV